jgi:hypothetical protein
VGGVAVTFQTQIAADMAVFFNTDEFAEAATYGTTEITVVEAEVGERDTGVPGFTVPLYAIFVKASDVARPKAGDAVTFRGVSCTVAPYPTSEGGIWRVELLKETVQA